MNGKDIGILLIGLTLVACGNSGVVNKTVSTDTDSIKTVSVDSFYMDENEIPHGFREGQPDKREPEIMVKRKSDYSETFLNGLKQLQGYEVFELIDSMLIINRTDTVYFPEFPRIGEHTVFTGIKDNLAIAVTVKRVNYTSVDHKIEMVEFGKTKHSQSGQADINPAFFLGSESDEDENTGITYFVNEFVDNGDNDCVTSIRIGEEEHIGFGKLIKNCNGEIRDIGLDNFPTLRRK